MFGILPIKIICHFKESMKDLVEEKFKKVDPENKLEPVILRDCEINIFEKQERYLD
jgi:hypothetical protein